MSLAEDYNLFMHGLNPQLCQLAGTMVILGDLEEVIEIIKKATVKGEDKDGSSQTKMAEWVEKWQGKQGNWGPSGRQKGKVQVIIGHSHPKVTTKTSMVLTGGASTSGGKGTKPNKQGKGPKGKPRKKPPLACFLCREKHIMKNCSQW